MTETRTAQHPALIAIQTIRNEGTRMYDLRETVRAEIARGGMNEAERMEYETSDEFLTAELAATTNKVIAAVDAARKAGLEFEEDLVYLPCKSTMRAGPPAWWLGLPFAWMWAHGRRRRAV